MPIIFFFLVSFAFSYDDPTGGKAFGPWLYNDQIKPMFKEARELQHLSLIGGALVGTAVSRPYDRKVREHRSEHRDFLMGRQESHVMSDLSNGWVEAGFSLVALGIDTPEGVKISRALLFTSLSTGVLKIFVNRERPDKSNNTSWPSGHTSSMFALAGALTYSYGLSAAVPAYSAAGLVALSRMRENKHWLSDVVAGAFIGTYWARVSYSVVDENAMSLMPVPVDDGMIIVFQKSL